MTSTAPSEKLIALTLPRNRLVYGGLPLSLFLVYAGAADLLHARDGSDDRVGVRVGMMVLGFVILAVSLVLFGTVHRLTRGGGALVIEVRRFGFLARSRAIPLGDLVDVGIESRGEGSDDASTRIVMGTTSGDVPVGGWALQGPRRQELVARFAGVPVRARRR